MKVRTSAPSVTRAPLQTKRVKQCTGEARAFLSSPAHPHHEHVPDTARLLKNPVGRREYAAADYCSDGDADYIPQLQRAFQFVVSNSSCPIIRTCAAARRAEFVAITGASMRKCDAMA